MNNFVVKFQETCDKFTASFKEASDDFIASFKEISIVSSTETYVGPYEITPAVDLQTLLTAQKFMTKDVTVNAIPFYNVGNTAGGSTVYIGTEV